MNLLTRLDRESLAARINALEAASKSLAEQPREAMDSIRRIAHSVRISADPEAQSDLYQTAFAVENAAPNELPRELRQFLTALRSVTHERLDKLKILVIDDQPEIADLIQCNLFHENCEVKVATTAADAREILHHNKISLIFLDLVLPDTDGRNLLIRLRENPRTAHIPVIVLTGEKGPAIVTECYALGADACFEKPIDPGAVSAAASSILWRVTKIKRDARKDFLTGLPNRAAFREYFVQTAALALLAGEPLCFGLADLDDFKQVNDTYGHAAGDHVLCAVVSVISSSLRKSDILGRWGGEELVILFPHTDPEGAVRALDKARVAVGDFLFQIPEVPSLKVTFSAGVVPVRQGATLEDTVAEADRLLYRAKRAGRNQIIWDPAPQTDSRLTM
jgi:diguanylate cyclase (GGDEF)-like protein